MTSGSTKQGDAVTSTRYIFAMSLLHWWLVRSPALNSHFPKVRTINAKNRDIHLDLDKYSVTLGVFEATTTI